jgi:hypothetical protein
LDFTLQGQLNGIRMFHGIVMHRDILLTNFVYLLRKLCFDFFHGTAMCVLERCAEFCEHGAKGGTQSVDINTDSVSLAQALPINTMLLSSDSTGSRKQLTSRQPS